MANVGFVLLASALIFIFSYNSETHTYSPCLTITHVKLESVNLRGYNNR